MGQYYKVCNIDKLEFLDPQDMGESLKIGDFIRSGSKVLAGLATLLADGNGRGGGDLRSDSPMIGRWARDRIVIAGDYADAEPDVDPPLNLYRMADGPGWTNISTNILKVVNEG